MEYEKNSLKRIIIIKGIILLVIILVIYFLYYSPPLLGNLEPINTTNESIATPSTMALVYMPVDYLFNYLNKGEYEKAFELLTDYTKNNVFNNDINKFTSLMKNEYINSELVIKRQRYNMLRQYNNIDGNKVYAVECDIYTDKMLKTDGYNVDEFCKEKVLNIHIVEYAPFNYKLDLIFDSEV